MDTRSSRNQEVLVLADFKESAVTLGELPRVGDETRTSQSFNQPTEPFASFHDMPQPSDLGDLGRPSGILIDADLAPYFPTADSVNDALRALVNIARRNGVITITSRNP